MGGNVEGLLDTLFRRGRDDSFFGLEDKRLDNYHVRTAAQAIVT